MASDGFIDGSNSLTWPRLSLTLTQPSGVDSPLILIFANASFPAVFSSTISTIEPYAARSLVGFNPGGSVRIIADIPVTERSSPPAAGKTVATTKVDRTLANILEDMT